MDKCLFTVLCGLMLLCTACDRPQAGATSETFSVTFVLDSDGAGSTRAATAVDETSIDNACLYFVDEGGAVVDAVSVESNIVLRNFEVGTYKVYAVANCGVTERSFSSESEISDCVRSLASEAGAFSMVATKTFSVPEDKTCNLTAERLVSKVEIDKISIDFSQYPDLTAKTFTIDSIYLVNVAGQSTLADGLDYIPASSSWINKRGYTQSQSDALVCEAVRRTVTKSSPHTVPHYFYCYQNNTTTDSHAAAWSARHTRLVIACTLGTVKTYYPIDITGPGGRLARNCRYVINELVITDLGSSSPDQVITGSMPYNFSSEVKSWEGTHTISERF